MNPACMATYPLPFIRKALCLLTTKSIVNLRLLPYILNSVNNKSASDKNSIFFNAISKTAVLGDMGPSLIHICMIDLL